jgi:hypothetical protein
MRGSGSGSKAARSPTHDASGNPGRRDRLSAAYLNALTDAAAVVCFPRPDATIGNGTLRDLVQAHEAGVEVRVVCSRGRLLGLEEAGLEVIPEPSTKAALSVWKKRAAWFSWTARALPTMFVVPRTGNG